MYKYNNNFMNIAISEAIKAKKINEVPVGAVIVDDKKNIISKAFNNVEKNNNSTLHAEKIAIESALKKTQKRYLKNCEIWVTLEPCLMCLGLIKLTRIRRLYYGADDLQYGSINGNFNFFQSKNCNHIPEIYDNIDKNECENILNNFFKDKR